MAYSYYSLEESKDFSKTKCGVAAMVVLALLLNVFGKFIATYFKLPLWLDSFGTCLVAYLYGPVCGAIVGVGLNISYGIFDHISLVFGIVSILLGLACGIMARKNFFETIYGAFFAGFVLSLIAIFTSTPLTLIFYDGYSGNQWNDGVFEMLMETGLPRWLSSTLGQFAIEFIDKNITTLSLYILIKFTRHRIKISHKKTLAVVLVCFLGWGSKNIGNGGALYALDTARLTDGFFTTTIFNDSNGLLGGEANSVTFSKDGYLWVGTYGGLYQYDGINFRLRNDYKSIKNVNCLYSDEEGRVWIGTNDNGLSVRVGDRISNTLDTETGLSSNSVKSICQDSLGNYYIGTSGKLNVVQLSSGIRISDTIDEVNYATSIASSEEGFVAAVTNSGKVHILKNGEYLFQLDNVDSVIFTSAFFLKRNILCLGTSSNKIFLYGIKDNFAMKTDEIAIGSLKNIKSMKKDENGIVWICADNGVGFMNTDGKFIELETGKFSTQIDSMGVDYQGNLWFTSSRLGLLRITESLFSNIYGRAKVLPKVVNAVANWNNRWYFGTDGGLDVMDKNFRLVEDSLSKRLSGQRIRYAFVDSKNHLWICVSSGDGLIEVLPNGTVNTYNSKNGAISNRFRTALELSDGTIAGGQYTGVDFINPEKKVVISKISSAEGLPNPMVLSIFEGKDGTVYVGTDGGGIAVVRGEKNENGEKNFKIEKVISRKDGLSSDVILKLIGEKNGDGIFIICGNGLNYLDANGNVKVFENFPYSNNFDLFETDNGKIFVLSGVGVFVTDKKALFSDEKIDDKEINYMLLNAKQGLSSSITANSKNYFSSEGELYVCCDNGCYVIDTKNYISRKTSYRMIVDYVLSDGDRYNVSRSFGVKLPGNDKNLEIHPVLFNYTMNEPYIGYCLEGSESKKTIVKAKDLSAITYSNLKNGKYNFKMELYSDDMSEILETVSYPIVKNMRIFDYLWFKAYYLIVCALFVAWCTWMIAKRVNKKMLEKEKRKLELAEMNARMSNETIMTIAQTVDAKDERTSKHSERVSEYSVQIAKKLGWNEEECENIRKMGLLHDIGKIGIPDAVLNKPGKLTDEEYAIMKTHVERGAEILKHFTLVKNVDLGAKYHHERYDGKGYPQGLKGEEIPIYARIIGIADAFDAMTSNRVYRNQLDLDAVIAEMERCKGTQFDPTLADLFLGLIKDGTINVEVLYK